MEFFRILLLPFSWLYGIGVFARNKFYDWGILHSKEPGIPVICIGNLSAGGTGKTPHVEYLARLLKDKHRIAILSRGYGRHTKGFRLVNNDSATHEVGDEPRQYKNKFTDISIAVDADRVHGIKKLKELEPRLEVILLDDAFQHRAVKAGLSILLSDYGHLYYKDRLLPAGMLREHISGASRADVIIVTKIPGDFTPMEQRIILKEINPQPHQSVYFSSIVYGELFPFRTSGKTEKIENFSSGGYSVQMLAGIANPSPLAAFLRKHFKEVKEMCFPDHHEYSIVDLERIKASFNAINSEKKIIITTEKDSMRLDKPGLLEFIKGLPIFYLPIEICFRDKEEQEFNKRIMDFIKQ